MWYGLVWCGGKAKEAASCWGRKWLYTQIGALTPTHFGPDAHHDHEDDNADDDHDDQQC